MTGDIDRIERIERTQPGIAPRIVRRHQPEDDAHPHHDAPPEEEPTEEEIAEDDEGTGHIDVRV
jgi:hypothetical protein